MSQQLSGTKKKHSQLFVIHSHQNLFPPPLNFLPNPKNCGISWVWPLPSNSDHQDYSILVGNPYKPVFATVTGKGPHPRFFWAPEFEEVVLWTTPVIESIATELNWGGACRSPCQELECIHIPSASKTFFFWGCLELPGYRFKNPVSAKWRILKSSTGVVRCSTE